MLGLLEVSDFPFFLQSFDLLLNSGGKLVLPDGVGIPIGIFGTKILTLQVRYQRTSLSEEVIDNSGFELHYTDDPRPKYLFSLSFFLETGLFDVFD